MAGNPVLLPDMAEALAVALRLFSEDHPAAANDKPTAAAMKQLFGVEPGQQIPMMI